MARVETIPCTKCGTAKVAMRNGKGAPFLGCPKCHADDETPAPQPQPEPTPAPQQAPVPAPPKPRRRFMPLLAMED